jgi:GDP-L-fucose synthase
MLKFLHVDDMATASIYVMELDTNQPDGAPRKLMNVERLANIGWRSSYRQKDGLSDTSQCFLDNQYNYKAK